MSRIANITLFKDVFNNDSWPVFSKNYVPDQEFVCDAISLIYPFAQGNAEAHRLWSKQITLETLTAIQRSTSATFDVFLSSGSLLPASKVSDHKRLWGRPELGQYIKAIKKSQDIRSEYREGVRYSGIGRFGSSNLSDLVDLASEYCVAIILWGKDSVDLTEGRVQKVYGAAFPTSHGEPRRSVSWPSIVTYAMQNNLLCLNLDSGRSPFNAHVNAHLIFGRDGMIEGTFQSLKRYFSVSGDNGSAPLK